MNKWTTSQKRTKISTLLTWLIIISMNFSSTLNVYAQPSLEAPETGTQENAKENVSDVDSDIEEDIESIIPTEWEEIEISTAEDLRVFAKNCSLDTWSRNKYVTLKNDISLYEEDFLTIPTFGGVFDGQNHTISNYNMYAAQTQIGIFANVQKQGIIKNLNVTGRIIPSGSQSIVGGIAGENSGIIMSCSFKGIIESKDYVGGIVGINRLEGIISDCKSDGVIMGQHFTGGIAGENMGNIIRCTNKAEVNTKEQDTTMSLEDIDIDSYLQIFSLNSNDTNTDSVSKMDDIVDTGGIAGLSIGVIEYCSNNGTIGHERIGYNVGGIVGRQSGYVLRCSNKGEVLGRKDVGGIVGQAEPYVTVDFTQDIVYQLSENINKLHDIIAVTLNDVDGSSDTITNRLSIIQQFTNGALKDTDYLASSSVDWMDGMVGSANEIIGRADYILQETAKQGGVIDQANSASSNMTTAGVQMANALSALDVYQYMTPQQQVEYQTYQNSLSEINKEYSEYLSNATKAYTHYYLDYIRHQTSYTESDGVTVTNYWSGTTNETDLHTKIGGSIDPTDKYDTSIKGIINPVDKQKAIYNYYKDVEEWKHYTGGVESDFPATDDAAHQDQRTLDLKLQTAVSNSSQDIASDANTCANTLYTEAHGSTYSNDVLDYSLKMANILNSDNVRGQMTEDTKKSVDSAIGYVNNASGDLSSAANQTKDIFNNITGRGSIVLPSLGADYKAHTTSLNNNLQGMSDNFGYLNQEMNNSTDTLVADLSAVNDQFNVIMMLYTDAIDGVLDKDYSNTIEDNSLEVAEVCTDATIASCENRGRVRGALNVSGIAGTMAIEYDYDLESDVTGIKDATLNTTYLTKCVLRDNENKGLVQAEKSYVAGICGLQEMGTIYRCSNFEKITSTSGEYVGGIAGSSLSDIVKSYAKGILDGKSFVGGIAGLANNISDSYTWISIDNADDYFGAIAGDVSSEGRIRNNYFVSNELAGINRISYSLKAEPIEYEELLLVEGIPQEFKNVRVVFILNDEDADEESIRGEEYISYGSELNPGTYPVVVPKEGYYVVWDETEACVYNDIEITATYERNRTTLSSEILRENGQSAILVDGKFKIQDSFVAYLTPISDGKIEDSIEYWELEIPDDGANTHQIRYAVPDKDAENIEDISVYYCDKGEWIQIDEVSTMGKYYIFDVPGNNVNIQIIDASKHMDIKKLIICILSGLALIAIIVVIVFLVKKQSKQSKKGKKKQLEKEEKKEMPKEMDAKNEQL